MLTRHEVVAHGGIMICKGGHDDGVFHQIIGLKSIEEVEVCATGCSWDEVLDELERVYWDLSINVSRR